MRKRRKEDRPLIRDLGGEFKALRASSNPQKRGYAFENVLAELFRRLGFAVKKSPRSTYPRQTDLLVYDPNLTVLASAKWENNPIGRHEVDALRLRLETVPSGAIGCLFSASDYAMGVPEHAAQLRGSFEIILFSPHEISMLLSGEHRFRELLEEKRHALRDSGKSIFRRARVRNYRAITDLDLPVTPALFKSTDGTAPVLHSRSNDFPSFVYAYRMPDMSYAAGARVTFSLPFETLGDLSKFLHALPATLGLSYDATFAIIQSHDTWHGYGARDLLLACEAWESRYEQAQGPFHHSEECILFSETRAGWLLLAFERRAESDRLQFGEVEIRLPGVPVDLAPYSELARMVGSPLFVEPLAESTVSDGRRSFRGPRLEVTHLITEDRNRTVRGLVAKNPFLDPAVELPKLGEYSPERVLRNIDLLVCTVSDMHATPDRMDYYYVTRIATLESAIRQVVEVTCTWNEWLDMPEPGPPHAVDWNKLLRVARRSRKPKKR